MLRKKKKFVFIYIDISDLFLIIFTTNKIQIVLGDMRVEV